MDISLKRIVAYIIDFFIVSIVANTIVTLTGLNSGQTIDYDHYINLVNDYNEKKVTDQEYEQGMIEFNYELSKSSVITNATTIVLIIAYFGIYQVIAKGQTIGKKLLKIKVVQNDDSKLTYLSAIIRTIILTNVILIIMNMVSVYLMNADQFNNFSYGISMVQGAIEIIIFIMVILRQDGRGLHDFLAKTKVVAVESQKESEPLVKKEENSNEKAQMTEKPKKTIEVKEEIKKKSTTKKPSTKTKKVTKTKSTK